MNTDNTNTQTNGTTESSIPTRPLSNYERHHGLTVEMRVLKGSRRSRAYRWAKRIATQEMMKNES